MGDVERRTVMSDRPRGRAWRSLSRLWRLGSSRTGRLVVGTGSAVAGLLLMALALRHFRRTPMPFSHGRPALLVAVGLLFLAAFLLKALGWGRLFAARERPAPVSPAAGRG